MGRNHVRAFKADTRWDLEDQINNYCSSNELEAISVSVTKDGGTLVAFVVVEDRHDQR